MPLASTRSAPPRGGFRFVERSAGGSTALPPRDEINHLDLAAFARERVKAREQLIRQRLRRLSLDPIVRENAVEGMKETDYAPGK
jgi:hypothetical protein